MTTTAAATRSAFAGVPLRTCWCPASTQSNQAGQSLQRFDVSSSVCEVHIWQATDFHFRGTESTHGTEQLFQSKQVNVHICLPGYRSLVVWSTWIPAKSLRLRLIVLNVLKKQNNRNNRNHPVFALVWCWWMLFKRSKEYYWLRWNYMFCLCFANTLLPNGSQRSNFLTFCGQNTAEKILRSEQRHL